MSETMHDGNTRQIQDSAGPEGAEHQVGKRTVCKKALREKADFIVPAFIILKLPTEWGNGTMNRPSLSRKEKS